MLAPAEAVSSETGWLVETYSTHLAFNAVSGKVANCHCAKIQVWKSASVLRQQYTVVVKSLYPKPVLA